MNIYVAILRYNASQSPRYLEGRVARQYELPSADHREALLSLTSVTFCLAKYSEGTLSNLRYS